MEKKIKPMIKSNKNITKYSAAEIAEIKQLLIQDPEGGELEPFRPRPLNELIKKCDRLLHDIAIKHVRSGRSIKKLKVFGAGGLLEAMIHYKEEKSDNVIFYLSDYIDKAILKELGDNAAIRIPEKARKKIKTVLEASNRLVQELYRDPSYEEIGDILGITGRDVMQILGSAVKDSYLSGSDKDVKDYFQVEEEAIRAYYAEKIEMEIQDQDRANETRVKEKSIPILESKEKYLIRITRIAHRLFPYDFFYYKNIKIIDGKKQILSIGMNRYNITSDEDGKLVFTLDEDHFLDKQPGIVKFLLKYKSNSTMYYQKNNKPVTDENGLPPNVKWLELVRDYAPKVYRHQMKEFLRALNRPEGTISNYCHDREGVIFKEDKLEPFYEKLEKYLKRTKKLKIGFSDLKRRTGKTLEQIISIDKDTKLIYPYKLDFDKKQLIRMF